MNVTWWSWVHLFDWYASAATMNRITWFRVFSRHSKRFNRDTAHTTKCSGSVSPHSSPDLPAILQTEQQGGNKKERQEDFNIALRSRTICPFHEPADGRGRNTSPRHKHTPAYFKVTCKSRHSQGSTQHDSTRYFEFSSLWIAPNDCTALDRIMCAKPYKQRPGFDSPSDRYNKMIFSLTFSVRGNVA